MIGIRDRASISLRLPERTLVSNQAAPRLTFLSEPDRLNHNVFRFPAKFHPPVVRRLIELYTQPGDTILDPFCGSGTTLIEALLAGRSGVGTDVDPLSILLTRAKTRRYDLSRLEAASEALNAALARMRQADERIWGSFEGDIASAEFKVASEPLAPHIPRLPNIGHWFRRRVVIQLAAIKSHIERFRGSPEHLFFELCFASIIRNSSNADPVPVSGLEVTKHMLEREEQGRVVDPYSLLSVGVGKALEATRRCQELMSPHASARVARADARHLSIRGTGSIDCVITSPPYLTAVDYYRRHTLEMFWLGLTATTTERLDLMPRYLGRDRVGQRHMEDAERTFGATVAKRWLALLPPSKPERQRAFIHYCAGMGDVLDRLADVTRAAAPVIIVVGNVKFNGADVFMPRLFEDLAAPRFTLKEQHWYPLANRYMSYERKNGADINAEHVLVFRTRNKV